MSEGLKMGILKKYDDGFVLPLIRYRQMEMRFIQLHDLFKFKIIGYINDGYYFLLAVDKDNYFKIPFARNKKWFEALMTEEMFVPLRDIPQIYVI